MRSRERAQMFVSLLAGAWLFLVSMAHGKSAEEKKFLAMVPGGVVTLDIIVDIGYRYSDQVQILQSELDGREAQYLRSLTATDDRLTGLVQSLSNRNELASPFGALINSRQQLDLTWAKTFETGTQVSSSLQSSQTEFQFLTPIPQTPDPFETRMSLNVRQSLWQNSFGEALTLGFQQAGERRKQIEKQYQAGLGDWFKSLEEVYHQAWMAQKRVSFAKERVQIQERLAKITRLLAKRGTADRADVLNSEQTLLQVQQGLGAARGALADIWRNLVILLKLPEEFLNIDPENVPIKESSLESQVTELCSPEGLRRSTSQEQAEIAALLAAVEASRLKLKLSEDALDPDLYVQATIGGNSFDAERTQTFSDALALKDPNYAVGLGIDITLGNSMAQAELLDAKKQLKQAQTQLSMKRSQIKIDWTNSCAEIKRLRRDRGFYQRMVKVNRERRKLEEDRFSLGKVEVPDVIMAAGDMVQSQEALAKAQVSLASEIWKLKKMRGDVPEFVAAVVKNSPLR